jgi:hypothetical protein
VKGCNWISPGVTFSKLSLVLRLCKREDDLIPGEYRGFGPGLWLWRCDMGDPGYVLPFNAVVDWLPTSSKYGELRSPRDSEAAVATDVRGSCRLWARGACWPER